MAAIASPTVVWRVRPGAADTNGGGFDPSQAGAGTDYSQQAAPVLSLSTISCAANATTITDASASGQFSAAMVGNVASLVNGTGFLTTSTRYLITGFTDANTLVLDRTPSTAGGTGGVLRIGGAMATTEALVTSSAPGPHVAAGHRVYVRSNFGSRYPVTTTLSGGITNVATSMVVTSTTGFPAAPFYAVIDLECVLVTAVSGTTWTITRAQGASTAAAHSSGATLRGVDYIHSGGATQTTNGVSGGEGMVAILSENGRPVIYSNGAYLLFASYVHLEGYSIICGGTTARNMVDGGSTGSSLNSISDCYFLVLGVATVANIRTINGVGYVFGNEIEGDSTTLFTTSTLQAILSPNSAQSNYIRNFPGIGIYLGALGQSACNNVIYNVATDGVFGSANGLIVANNTIDTVGGHGINIGATGGIISTASVFNNIIANVTVAGKFGIYHNAASSTGTVSRNMLRYFRNFFFNVTNAYPAGVTPQGAYAGADVIGTDPGFVAASTGNHGIGAALKGLAWPTGTLFASRSYDDPGAIQRQEPPYSHPEVYLVG